MSGATGSTQSDPRPLRVAHLVSHPIPYFAPLYRELSARDDLDLTVFFYSTASARRFRDPEFEADLTWDVPLLAGYRYRVVESAKTRGVNQRRWTPSLGLLAEVHRGDYDVIWAHGYAHINTWLAFASALIRRRGFVIRDESTLQHSRPLWRRVVKELLLRPLFSRAVGPYIGEENKRYLSRYGMTPDRMFAAPYCVDNAFFQSRHAELAPRRDAIRRRLGITDDAPVLLYCGKLIPKKRPLEVIDAFAGVRAGHRCWLLMVGDGTLLSAAKDHVERRDIPNVIFTGFLNQTEIGKAYEASDLFVLFSGDKETWGLVVNEAMNFELPIVVSNKVGSGADLVHQGANGYVVGHDDVAGLKARLTQIVRMPAAERRALGRASGSIVDRYSLEACADGIVAACRAAAPSSAVGGGRR